MSKVSVCPCKTARLRVETSLGELRTLLMLEKKLVRSVPTPVFPNSFISPSSCWYVCCCTAEPGGTGIGIAQFLLNKGVDLLADAGDLNAHPQDQSLPIF